MLICTVIADLNRITICITYQFLVMGKNSTMTNDWSMSTGGVNIVSIIVSDISFVASERLHDAFRVDWPPPTVLPRDA